MLGSDDEGSGPSWSDDNDGASTEDDGHGGSHEGHDDLGLVDMGGDDGAEDAAFEVLSPEEIIEKQQQALARVVQVLPAMPVSTCRILLQHFKVGALLRGVGGGRAYAASVGRVQNAGRVYGGAGATAREAGVAA